MTIKNPTLEKVFIALRTNFFEDYPKEHITLKYFHSITWETLLRECAQMEERLPATIRPLFYSTWQSWSQSPSWYEGLIVDSQDSLIFGSLNMPHTTLPTGYIKTGPPPGDMEPQIVDTLWIGKSINGHYIWAKHNSKQLGEPYGIVPETLKLASDLRGKTLS
jgi:hypothetical protein